MREFSSGDAMEVCERTKRGCMGVVEIIAQIDDPGADDHGQVVDYFSSNTITWVAREIMAEALAGKPEAKITTVAWGSGTTAPSRDDTALEAQIIASVVSQVGYPTNDSVVFSATLPPGTGAGTGYNETFSEVGLMTADGRLFARFTFPPQTKFERLRLSVNWQIFFV